MRITSSMYYESLYSQSNSKITNDLFDVNKQIASGLKIQYASDDISVFTETMRLDNEIAVLGQIKQSTESGYKIANQTDVILNEFETSMNRTRTLLVSAANGTNDEVSLNAISSELRGIEDHFKNLANSSINGQYIFSGTAVDVKPIADDGTYMGNDVAMNSFLGSNIQQQNNLTGAELFLGEEARVNRLISTNVANTNYTSSYPDFTDASVSGANSMITTDDTIRSLMGDSDNDIDTVNAKHHFYINGTKSDGTAFKEKISMRDDESVNELLERVGIAYGNKPDLKVVNVTMNDSGQIVIEDKIKGSSKLDFQMVGATDFDANLPDDANVNTLDLLDNGERNFEKIINGTSSATNPNLHVKEFVRTSSSPASGAATNIEGLTYDNTAFTKDGSKLSSNSAQIVKADNSFATGSTKISEVADLSQGTAGTLDGTQFTYSGTNIYGNSFDVDIDLKNSGSTFSLDGGVTNYEIYNADNTRTGVSADEMTYQQLTDVMNMIITDNIPASTNTASDYDAAFDSSSTSGYTYLSNDGKIEFQDIINSDTKAQISLYDSNSGDFTKDASVSTFNSNNALTIRDPKTDFFSTLNEMITAVENYSLYPDGDGRNVGIENAITMMDDLQDHVFSSHALVGTQSNSLSRSLERTELLEISTMTLRSSVVDTDLAEASLELTQLNNNYQAMLSTVGKVSQLSLVNYL